jgi:hypothetical protein
VILWEIWDWGFQNFCGDISNSEFFGVRAIEQLQKRPNALLIVL